MTSLALTDLGQTVVTATFERAMTRAGQALGAMSGEIITASAPDVERASAADVLALAGGPEQIVVAVYVAITGSLQGHALLMLPPADAHRLASILLAGLLGPGELPYLTEDPFAFDELELSALQEAGNVTISAFLNELGMHLHEPVQPTVPQVVVEMAGAVLDGIPLDLVAECDEVLAAEARFSENGRDIEGTLMVLPRAGSLAVLLDALGVPAT